MKQYLNTIGNKIWIEIKNSKKIWKIKLTFSKDQTMWMDGWMTGRKKGKIQDRKDEEIEN